jgi:hypothetical protein
MLRLMTRRLVFSGLLTALLAASSVATAAPKKSASSAPATPPPPPAAATAPAATETVAPTTPVVAGAEAATQTPSTPVRIHLVAARELVAQGRGEAALAEIDLDATQPGTTPESQLDLLALKAQALLLQKVPNEAAAREAFVAVLRRDPDGVRLQDLPAGPARRLADRIREEAVIVTHTPPLAVRPGLPVKLRAKLLDPQDKSGGLTLHFRGAGGAWAIDRMKRDHSGLYTGVVRDPGALAPAGVSDGFGIDYFISVEDPLGKPLDADGSETAPLQLRVDASAVKLEPLVVPAPAAPIETTTVAPAPTVWWKRWYVLTAAGVVVAGLTAGIVVAATSEPELQTSLGIINLP